MLVELDTALAPAARPSNTSRELGPEAAAVLVLLALCADHGLFPNDPNWNVREKAPQPLSAGEKWR